MRLSLIGHFAVRFAFLTGFLLVLLDEAPGQQITGSITGSVYDSSGAAIVNANVRVTNTGTGAAQSTLSDNSGNFRFVLLPPGVYALEATRQGFKTFRRDGIVVEADRSLGVPVTLNIGQVSETVEVIGGTPLLEPNTSDLGTTVDAQKIAELPLNARNPMGLANLVPTVKGMGFFGQQVLTSWRIGAVNVGGGQPLTSAFLLDGVPNDKMGDAAGANTYLTTDSTEEFKVITNSMSAEFGRTGGGVISIISKAGSNSFHGTLFDYLQNNKLNANDFFSNASGVPLAPIAQNQWGGSLGGRLIRDKLFFFGNFEGFNQHISQSELVTSPTAAQRAGDFSQTFAANGQLITIYDPLTTLPNPATPGAFSRQPFPGNAIPGDRISQLAKAVWAMYPLGNLPGLAITHTQNLFLIGKAPTDRQTGGVRIDYNLRQNRRLAVRYTRDVLNESVPTGNYFKSVLDNDKPVVYVPRHSGMVQYTESITPTLVLDARSGINRDYDHGLAGSSVGPYVDKGFNLSSLGFPTALISQLQTGPSAAGLFPMLAISDLLVGGTGTGLGSPGPGFRAAYTWGNSISVTKIVSGHTVKAGYQYTYYAGNPYDRTPMNFTFNRGFTQGPNPTVASVTAGFGLASFDLGMPASGAATYVSSREFNERDHAVFVQDDWKVSRRLTLNLGLRWEYQGPFKDRFNEMTNFDPNAAAALQVPGLSLKGVLIFPGVNGVPRGVVEESVKHFGPRFGFGYQAAEKLVARGGYAITYVPEKGILAPSSTGFGSATSMIASLDNGLTPYNTVSDPFPQGLVLPTGSSLGTLTGVGSAVSGQLRNVLPGYVQQWNFTLQYSPWDNWLVEGAYLGNKGTHLQTLQGFNLNQLAPQYLSLGNALNQQVANPFFGIVSSGPLGTTTVARQQLLLPYPQYVGVNGGWTYNGNSIYHAFALKVEKRFSSGFTILASYTISKLIDAAVGPGGALRTNGPPETGIVNWYDLSKERAKSIYDIPQRLIFTGIWEIPVFRHAQHSWQRLALGGWNANGILTLQSGQAIALQSGSASQRPNVVAGVSDQMENQTLTQWFNTAAFAPPAPFTYGNASRTIPNISSDGMFDLDFALYKSFFITERFRLNLKCEAYNLTNTPTFDVPGRDVTSQTFGVVSATALVPRPRAVQLSLRLTF
jgi:hypothetical protein